MNNLDDQLAEAEKEWIDRWMRGPTRTRWTKPPLQPGDPAPDLRLLDFDGNETRLREFWRDKAALLLFWRHYGCSCGRERAARLKGEYHKFKSLGANVVVIGQGEPERAKDYARRFGIPCPVLCDPTYTAYEAYDLLEGKPSQILFDMPDEYLKCDFESGLHLSKSRHGTDRALVDSPWQMPGEFVVDRNGVIRLAYRYQYCEDWPNPLVLIAALKEALWEAA